MKAGKDRSARGAGRRLRGGFWSVIPLKPCVAECTRADGARASLPGSRSSPIGPGWHRHCAFDDFAVDAAVWFAGLLFFEELFVGAEGQQGPAVSIHVVFQIKHAGKTGAGGFVLGPRAVRVLHAVRYSMPRTSEGRWGSPKVQKAHDGPRRFVRLCSGPAP